VASVHKKTKNGEIPDWVITALNNQNDYHPQVVELAQKIELEILITDRLIRNVSNFI